MFFIDSSFPYPFPGSDCRSRVFTVQRSASLTLMLDFRSPKPCSGCPWPRSVAPATQPVATQQLLREPSRQESAQQAQKNTACAAIQLRRWTNKSNEIKRSSLRTVHNPSPSPYPDLQQPCPALSAFQLSLSPQTSKQPNRSATTAEPSRNKSWRKKAPLEPALKEKERRKTTRARPLGF